MKIQSKDFPQADRLESVIAATIAVNNGSQTDIEIANHIPFINGDSRQGRYYRRAAEILGFIANNRNNAVITTKGSSIAINPSLDNPTLIESVLNLSLYQKLLPYFELHPEGLNRTQIIEYLQIISEGLSGSTIARRLYTIIPWIVSLGVIEQVGDLYRLSRQIIPRMPIIELNDIEQPLLPITGDLREYQIIAERVSNATDIIAVYKNQAKTERSNNSHIRLLNLIAARIKNAGGIPKSNQLIDVATKLNEDYIFEIKSTDINNAKSQVRKGISQLYEYRYLQSNSDANLILVVENPLIGNNNWMIDYLENDRNINLIWDGDNNNLFGTERTRRQLGFLELS